MSHYVTADVWVGNCDGEGDAEQIQELIESALSGAGYQVTVSTTTYAYAAEAGEGQ